MPTVLNIEGFRFFFYSADWHEPVHVHIEHAEGKAKFWLEPIALASSYKMRSHDLRRARMLLEEHRELIKEKWHEYFGRSDR